MMLAWFLPQTTRRTSMRRSLAAMTLVAGVTLVATPHVGAGAQISLVPAGEIGGDQWGLDSPSAIAVDHRGRLLVVDSGNHRVLVIGVDGTVVMELGGYGWKDDRLNTPLDVVVDPGLATFVLDAGNRRVIEFDAEGNYVGVVLTESQTGTPVGLALGSGGELFVADADAQIVRVYSQFAEPLEPLGRFGGEQGGLITPVRVAMGPAREIAIADPGASAVRLYDEFGSLLRQITPGEGFSPLDVLFDSRGNIFVADPSSGTVSVFDRSGNTAVAAAGRDALGPDAAPSGLAFDRAGRLLVLDATSGRVLVFELEYDIDR